MAYEAKKALLNSNKGSSTEYYKDFSQRILNQSFLNASNVYEIEVQKSINSNEYIPMTARISTAMSKSNQMTNLYNTDSFKKLTFPDLDYIVRLGQRFKMFGYHWFSTEVNALTGTFSDCIVQRCNSVLYFLDSKGNLIEEPCKFQDATQYGSGDLDKSNMMMPHAMGILLVPRNNLTESIIRDQRIYADRRHWKITKIDGENSLDLYNSQEGLLRLAMRENYEDINVDDQYLADRYKYQNRKDIKFEYEKLLSYTIGDVFVPDVIITKDGLPYTMTDIKYDLSHCPFLIKTDNGFKVESYGIGRLKITYHEDGFDEFIDIQINCIDESVDTPTYKIVNDELASDDFIVRRLVEKVYSLKKYIGTVEVGNNAIPSFKMIGVSDISKVEVNIINEKISIYNIGVSDGLVEIGFEDNGVTTKQDVKLMR